MFSPNQKMRFKVPAAINVALIFVLSMTMNSAQGKRGNMSDVPMDNLRGLFV
jgi:hypothetical protein